MPRYPQYEPKWQNNYDEIARARAHYLTHGTPYQFKHGTKRHAKDEATKWLVLVLFIVGTFLLLSWIKG